MNKFERIEKALLYIEENLKEDIRVSDVADVACFSMYHFHRIFLGMTGDTAGEYMRKRRLSKAAEELLQTSKKIYEIAYDLRFESQESFTRSFKKQFGITPGQYRKLKHRSDLFIKKEIDVKRLKHLTGGITMNPTIKEYKEFTVIGVRGRTNLKDNKIPQIWESFMRNESKIQNRSDRTNYYGICENEKGFNVNDFNDETEFNTLVSVEVTSTDLIPEGMVSKTIPAGKYAVFTHKGALSKLQLTYDYIWGSWVDNTEHEIDARDDFELYDDRFVSPESDHNIVDIYIPIK